MKICPACSETFESHSRFCPIDGSILDQAKSRETYGYSPDANQRSAVGASLCRRTPNFHLSRG